jgi:hypothetical protein
MRWVAAVFLALPVTASAASATSPLDDPVFTTAVPAGWHERTKHDPGRTYFFNSGSGHANNLGLPGRGQIGLTIGVYHVKRGTSARHVLQRSVGSPRGAKNVRFSRTRKSRLAGAPAATVMARYRYKGVRWVQRDVVAVRGTHYVFVEVDAGPKKSAAAKRTMATVRDNWRWK